MSNINPIFAQLALDWLDAERVANPDAWPAVPQRDHMTIAIDRVYQVISGNVLLREATPGDKAIWKSRIEDITAFARTWRRTGTPIKPERQENYDPYNQVTPRTRRRPRERSKVWWNYYDTARIDQNGVDGEGLSQNLFSNRNIGKPFLTNLQVPGQMGEGSSFEVCSFYVAISSIDALQWAGDRILFTFQVGASMRYMPPMFMRDLFRGVVLPKTFTIPERQNFAANVSLRERYPSDMPPFDVTFHFEGFESRE